MGDHMSDDFERLKELISRSRSLKKEASRMNAEAMALDAEVRDVLAAMREQAAESDRGKIERLASEAGTRVDGNDSIQA